MQALKISAYTLTNAMGQGCKATLAALRDRQGGLRPNDFDTDGPTTWIGRVDGIEASPLSDPLGAYDCRNNRLAAMALVCDDFEARCAEARERLGADRIGVFMGTSTSGVEQTERAYQARKHTDSPLPDWYDYTHTHDMFSLAAFVRARLGLRGPAATVSTACSSSAKVFATAWRHIEAGLCSAAVVGGVDSLCRMTLHGFDALQLVSPLPCRPADGARDGISIGEAAAFALLEPVDDHTDGLCVLGYGESNDAYHMSAPEPSGRGAASAMRAALNRAGLDAADIDFIHLHGTATPANDAAEDVAVSALFGARVPCASTKGWTGHTLGAAGASNALIAALCIEHAFIPGSLNTESIDPTFSSHVQIEGIQAPLARVMSNAFGFGGSNASLIIGRRP
ncbi:beta-ketoacyl-[acyl-carrier-protein] synthase II [Acidihalobacter yilgarnensis]|uniref:Beta-ketoacyl-[acyl-carrier-protein] synthase II n=1 Tax=Acidihalobacter yilgarnensis TaxID=2819280 RepID=A0A1D8ITW1_9GAMM|nr:beta-ketoacyl-[acyl-carrier-protein] synthase family protein [Acidihalobacter yilgarnensis]AOU99825.1 beta-ketoacyl-[acyl-carrier-protein] synthase II [Acidihalobacter yilgarnensis]